MEYEVGSVGLTDQFRLSKKQGKDFFLSAILSLKAKLIVMKFIYRAVHACIKFKGGETYLTYGWSAGNLNRPIRIQQAGKILVS